MENLRMLFQNLPGWLVIFPIIIILYFIAYLFWAKKSRGKQKDFLEKNPSASLLYCEAGQRGIKSLQVYILSIDGEKNVKTLSDGIKTAHVLMPGTHIIEASASTNRPGLLYRNVTENFGPEKLEVSAGEAKKYELGFDIDSREFKFTEL